MPDINRADLNRAISEAIEPLSTLPDPADAALGLMSPKQAWLNTTARMSNTFNYEWVWQPRAWDTDETANAQIFEMMPRGTVSRRRDGLWEASPDAFLAAEIATHADRKTAIRDAAHQWLTQRQGAQ